MTSSCALHEALDRFAEAHPEKAELVKLRYFAGLTADQAAEALGHLTEHRRPPLGLCPSLAPPGDVVAPGRILNDCSEHPPVWNLLLCIATCLMMNRY